MAGAGYKLFNTGDVLTAAQVNTYLQEQVVMVFANAAARTTALSGVLAEGMVSYLKDTDALEIYSGSAWVGYGSGDITGVTAGTGISGGGTSGTVTITNSMATEITAAGDIIVGTGSGTFDNLPIGTTGQVLTADTTVSPYKVKWASAASGGAYTLINSGGTTLTGASVTITLSGTYTDLYVIVRNFKPTTQDRSLFMRFNADSNTRYKNINVDYGYTSQSFDQDYLRVTSRQSNSVANGLAVVHIPDYQNTATFKLIHNYAFGNAWSPTTDASIAWNVSAYNQTGAITSLVFHEESGSNLNGGTVFVYGVK